MVAVGGNLDDWASKNVDIATRIYERTPEGSNLSYDQVAEWTPVIEEQLVLGGYRLAHILNSIYDPTYANRKAPAEF